MAVNPLRRDPSRTMPLVARWLAVFRRRLAIYRADLRRLLIEEDALGLRAFVVPTTNARWRYLDAPERSMAFRRWAEGQARDVILGGSEAQLWDGFVRDGHRRGAARAYRDARNRASRRDGARAALLPSQDEFLRRALGRAASVERLRLLTGRSREEMRGLASTLTADVARVVSQGILAGSSPEDVADVLERALGMAAIRAERIARTEMVRAAAEGQLDGMEELGEERVGLVAELSTAGDARVCDLCGPMEGEEMTLEEARGVIPIHAMCRCSWRAVRRGEPG